MAKVVELNGLSVKVANVVRGLKAGAGIGGAIKPMADMFRAIKSDDSRIEKFADTDAGRKYVLGVIRGARANLVRSNTLSKEQAAKIFAQFGGNGKKGRRAVKATSDEIAALTKGL